jgi:hypothetical protein
MSKVVGVVESIKDFPSPRGTMYSIKVNGVMYGTGSVQPKAGVGDTVAFEVTENGKYKNANMKTFSIEAGAPVFTPAPSGGGKRDWVDTQPVIERQSALNSAIAFLNVVVAAGALPGTTAKSSADDKYGILEALLTEKAEEFHAASTGKRAPGGQSVPSKGGVSMAEEKAAAEGSWQ